MDITGEAVRFKTRRDHRLRFDGLLIKACALTALRIKPIRSDWDEMSAVVIRALQIGKPLERFETSLCHRVI